VKVKVISAQDTRDWILSDNHYQLLEHSVIGTMVVSSSTACLVRLCPSD